MRIPSCDSWNDQRPITLQPRRPKQCRIFVSLVGQQITSLSSSCSLFSFVFPLSRQRFPVATGSCRQGGRRLQFADTILPAALRAVFPPFLSFFAYSSPCPLYMIPLSPFYILLSLSIYLYLLLLLSVRVRLKIRVSRPVDLYQPGTGRYIFPQVTTHREHLSGGSEPTGQYVSLTWLVCKWHPTCLQRNIGTNETRYSPDMGFFPTNCRCVIYLSYLCVKPRLNQSSYLNSSNLRPLYYSQL